MKQNLLICLSAYLFVCISLSSCVPDDDLTLSVINLRKPLITVSNSDTSLPPITMTGKNTFGYKVNGKTWLPLGGMFTYYQLATYGESKGLNISAQHNRSHGDAEFFKIQLKEIRDTGYYAFPDPDLVWCLTEYSKVDSNGYVFIYSNNPIDNGYFHLTRLNLISGFVSGTFAFDLYDDNGDTVHITEGRFDIRF